MSLHSPEVSVNLETTTAGGLEVPSVADLYNLDTAAGGLEVPPGVNLYNLDTAARGQELPPGVNPYNLDTTAGGQEVPPGVNLYDILQGDSEEFVGNLDYTDPLPHKLGNGSRRSRQLKKTNLIKYFVYNAFPWSIILNSYNCIAKV